MNVNQKHPVWLVAALVLVVFAFSAAPALAASPVLTVNTVSVPTNLPPGGEGEILLQINNLGDAPANGEINPIAITEKLPAGLVATAISGAECELKTLHCVARGILQPYTELRINITVKVENSASGGLVNEVALSGGGAAPTTTRHALTVSPTPASFGVEDSRLVPTNEDGSIDTQAGSHPFQLTTTVAVNTLPGSQPVALTKDLHFSLPAGLVGNPQVIPQCTSQEFGAFGAFTISACPAETAIGVANVRFRSGQFGTVPLFNLVPSVGEPARFGLSIAHFPVILDTAVRTGGDYGVVVSVNNISQTIAFLGAQVTFWGVPADPSHNNVRGWGCLWKTVLNFEPVPCVEPVGPRLIPFLTLPTSCSGPAGMRTTVETDSWSEPGVFTKGRESLLEEIPGEPLGLVGCNRLPFEPSIGVAPDSQAASTPTGLTTDVNVPQEGVLNPTGLAPSNIKDVKVVLPEGMAISPAGGGGLEACSDAQIGYLPGESSPPEDLHFTSGLPAPKGAPVEPFCPDAAKVGTVKVRTPLLANPLEGAAYLATQDANPFGSLMALYLVAEDSVSGVLIKQPGEVSLDQQTGQITATFPGIPDVPLEQSELHFFGSARAPLSTPPTCGSYTTKALFTPWSGSQPVESSSTLDITSGPNGSACASPRPFQPGFEAGTTSVQAGGFTPLTLTMTRPDADQQLGRLSVVLPPGVSAGLRGVKLCEEPQAAAGDCPAESQIGQVVASAGLGNDPYSIESGKAYITGPYEGDPFGVDVVVPAVAGPFNLGTEVVRAKVDVDPTDAHLTVVSDKFPTMLDGIPLQLQHVNVTVNRPGFVFNPSSCEPMKLTGELESSEGATSNVSTPFQVTNCAALSFKPEFKVSTSAKTSRVDGASLHATLTLPAGAQGTKANVARVKVSLPPQLPSPLKTLQKACTEKVFAENPASCPLASRVGEATVQTPVLEGPLSGPAYFVSHGGARYPELIIVLRGEDGVTVQVHGETLIKNGITTASFNTVPDVPFSGFELTLPEREYPALSANGNLCKAQAAGKLLMPTELVAQNGLAVKQSTKISVTGCPKHKKKAAKKAKRNARRGRGHKKR